MSDPFVAEIFMMGCNFAPRGFAFCNGQVLPISQNTALFALLGTQYGGDGKTTFALPNLQGRAPMHQGQGPGLTLRGVGENGGSSAVTLTESELPAHDHAALARTGAGLPVQNSPENKNWAATAERPYGTPSTVAMSPQAIATTGGGVPHNNLSPYLALNFVIALQGVFPSRP
ncbi:MAG: phage tail protein [Micromonosporaceae bacterium]